MSSKSWHASTLGARPLAPETLMMARSPSSPLRPCLPLPTHQLPTVTRINARVIARSMNAPPSDTTMSSFLYLPQALYVPQTVGVIASRPARARHTQSSCGGACTVSLRACHNAPACVTTSV
jgi:hypothetical protein